MSSQQGWFESDEDYRERIAREADEHTIEESTGSAPSQGWFESDEDYRDRVAQEANESRIEKGTGSAPSQGWFESDEDYRDRIEQEANEATIEEANGSAPSQGWFESDENYNTRVRREANEGIVERGTGSAPRQGWLEGDHDYRSRIADEAREVRASERTTGADPDDTAEADDDANDFGEPDRSSGTDVAQRRTTPSSKAVKAQAANLRSARLSRLDSMSPFELEQTCSYASGDADLREEAIRRKVIYKEDNVYSLLMLADGDKNEWAAHARWRLEQILSAEPHLGPAYEHLKGRGVAEWYYRSRNDPHAEILRAEAALLKRIESMSEDEIVTTIGTARTETYIIDRMIGRLNDRARLQRLVDQTQFGYARMAAESRLRVLGPEPKRGLLGFLDRLVRPR